MRYTPFFLNFNVKVGNLFFRLTSSFSKTSENRLLFVMKVTFAEQQVQFPVVVFQLSVLFFPWILIDEMET